MKEQMFSIGQAEKLTGVSQKSLRFWEEKKYIPAIQRIRCGEIRYRFYSVENLELITRIKSFLDQGFTLPAASMKAQKIQLGG